MLTKSNENKPMNSIHKKQCVLKKHRFSIVTIVCNIRSRHYFKDSGFVIKLYKLLKSANEPGHTINLFVK